MTPDEMMTERADVGARYDRLVAELLQVRVELQAIDHVTSSPIAHRHNQSGFVGDVNELPRLLSHAVFSPYVGRRLSAEVEQRVSKLAASLRSNAA
jgi:hypothetical protein